MSEDVLRFSRRVTALPIVHGSGDFALEVRRVMLDRHFDCLAVPLPPSFQAHVEQAIEKLPTVSMVIQPTALWSEGNANGDEEIDTNGSHVPVDPCQGVIAALRIAIQERIPRAFIDLETDPFLPCTAVFPDAYALKTVPVSRYAASVLPALAAPPEGQPAERIQTMGARLRQLEARFESVLLVCSLTDWPWIRQAFHRTGDEAAPGDFVEPTHIYQPTEATLFFLLGELPYVTGLYERARQRLEDDENLTIDGVKEMLLEARKRYQERHKHLGSDLSPKTLSLYLKYVRNLSLIENRLTPNFHTLVLAAKQIAGDGFALELVDTARSYPYQRSVGHDEVTLGIDKVRLPDGRVIRSVSRLPGPPLTWGKIELIPPPPKIDQEKWRMRWNPFGMCSHVPEDVAIERFRSHVVDRAKAIIGLDLARSEKFTTSLKDGLDIRETLRHFYSGDIYVKVNPPVRGDLDCVVMLFDTPADPRKYPWRSTWHAEHKEESTLAFYATDYLRELVGPGIGRAEQGGAMFLFPPVRIRDIWLDEGLDFADTLEERILAAACAYSRNRHIALLSPAPPGSKWRKMARQFGKRWVHVPMSRFSTATLRQLRVLHVLNGREVRSYADHFIRRP